MNKKKELISLKTAKLLIKFIYIYILNYMINYFIAWLAIISYLNYIKILKLYLLFNNLIINFVVAYGIMLMILISFSFDVRIIKILTSNFTKARQILRKKVVLS